MSSHRNSLSFADSAKSSMDFVSLRSERDALLTELEAERTRALASEKQIGHILMALTHAHGRAMALQRSRGIERALEAYHVVVEELAHICESERRARIAISSQHPSLLTSLAPTPNPMSTTQSGVGSKASTPSQSVRSSMNFQSSVTVNDAPPTSNPTLVAAVSSVSSAVDPPSSVITDTTTSGLIPASNSIIDELRGRIFLLEQQLKQAEESHENLRDARRLNQSLRVQYQNVLLDTLSKKRHSDDKKKCYNTLLKALAIKTFYRDRQIRRQLVGVIEKLHHTLTEIEVNEWQRYGQYGKGKTIHPAWNEKGQLMSSSSTTSIKDGSKRSKRQTALSPASPSSTSSTAALHNASSNDDDPSSLPLTSTHTLHSSPSQTMSHSSSKKLSKTPAASSSNSNLNSTPPTTTTTTHLSSPSSSASPSVSSPLAIDGDASLSYLTSGDDITLRDTSDFHLHQHARKHFLEHVVRAPRQKISVLLESLEDVLIVKLDRGIRRLACEASRSKVLSESHLQTILAHANEKASCARRATELEQRLATLETHVRTVEEAHAHAQQRILELQHEAHLASTRRVTDEQKQIALEQREVAGLVERAHTLRRKVRDAEAVLAALEKKKARLQRQGFTTGATTTTTTTGAHGSIDTSSSASVSGGADATSMATGGNGISSGLPSKRGIGGGGLGLLTMAMMNARDELTRTEQALAKAKFEILQQQQHQQQQQSPSDHGGDMPLPDPAIDSPSHRTDEEKETSSAPPPPPKSAPSQPQPQSHTQSQSHGGTFFPDPSPPSARSRTANSRSRRRLSRSPSTRASRASDGAALVTHATIGRLQITLPIVPLYSQPPPSDRTRPMSNQPLGASHGYNGITGFGPSAGLRVGQRLDRRLGDFEKIAVQQLGQGRSSDHRGSSGTRNMLTSSSMGSSTGSVTASANVASQRFGSSAYKQHHVPFPPSPPTVAPTQVQSARSSHPTATPFFAGDEVAAHTARVAGRRATNSNHAAHNQTSQLNLAHIKTKHIIHSAPSNGSEGSAPELTVSQSQPAPSAVESSASSSKDSQAEPSVPVAIPTLVSVSSEAPVTPADAPAQPDPSKELPMTPDSTTSSTNEPTPSVTATNPQPATPATALPNNAE